ncbi:MAG: hypothetical protein KBD21_01750 [Candidatus Pacebacteria bacterium]|nr:hypothetical protein [Candidatus Paceibacterota bacterium]
MVMMRVVTVVVIVPFFMATIFPLLVTLIVSAILPPEALMVRSIVPWGWYVPFRPLHRHHDDGGWNVQCTTHYTVCGSDTYCAPGKGE